MGYRRSPPPATLRLARPTVDHRRTFLQGAGEFVQEGRLQSTYAPGLGYTLERLRREFSRFVADLTALGTGGRNERFPYADHVWWLIADGEYAGQVSIRPELGTDFLITYGGHIGYSIRPSLRGKGYGTRILALALPLARDLGLKRVLVTCNADNEPSRRIIEHCGGRFECSLPMPPRVLRIEGLDPEKPLDKLRFWIDLTHADPSC